MDVIVDFETSGLNPLKDWPIQVGMVGINKEKVLFELEFLILPPNPNVARLTEHLTKINPQKLLTQGYPPSIVYSQILRILFSFEKNIKNMTFYAWNHNFDRNFMFKLEELAGTSEELRLSSCQWQELQPYHHARLQGCFLNSIIPDWFRERFELDYAHNGIVDCYRAIIASERFRPIVDRLNFAETRRFKKPERII